MSSKSSSKMDSLSIALEDVAAEECMLMQSILLEGAVFLKYGKKGAPKYKSVYCDTSGSELILRWADIDVETNQRKSAPPKAKIRFTDITMLMKGKQSKVLARKVARSAPDFLCFSIVTKKRTLDLQAASGNQRDLWVKAIAQIVQQKRSVPRSVPGAGLGMSRSAPASGALLRRGAPASETSQSSENSVSLSESFSSDLNAQVDDKKMQETEESQMLRFLSEGGIVIKHGRKGAPKKKRVFASKGRLYWCKPNNKSKAPSTYIMLNQVKGVLLGKNTDVFARKTARKVSSQLLFSIITDDRTLDIQLETKEERDRWVRCLRFAQRNAKQKQTLLRRILHANNSNNSHPSGGGLLGAGAAGGAPGSSPHPSPRDQDSLSLGSNEDSVSLSETTSSPAGSRSRGVRGAKAGGAAVDEYDDEDDEYYDDDDDAPPPPPPPAFEPEDAAHMEALRKDLAAAEQKRERARERKRQRAEQREAAARAEAERLKAEARELAERVTETRGRSESEARKLQEQHARDEAAAIAADNSEAAARAMEHSRERADEQSEKLLQAQAQMEALERKLQAAQRRERRLRKKHKREKHRRKQLQKKTGIKLPAGDDSTTEDSGTDASATDERSFAAHDLDGEDEDEETTTGAGGTVAAAAPTTPNDDQTLRPPVEDDDSEERGDVADASPSDPGSPTAEEDYDDEDEIIPNSALARDSPAVGPPVTAMKHPVKGILSTAKPPSAQNARLNVRARGIRWKEQIAEIKEVESIIVLAGDYSDSVDEYEYDDDDEEDSEDMYEDEDDDMLDELDDDVDDETAEYLDEEDFDDTAMDDDEGREDWEILVPVDDPERLLTRVAEQRRVLADASADWNVRVDALQQLGSLVEGQDVGTIHKWWKEMEQLRKGLAVQLDDLRSAVVRASCNVLVILTSSLGHYEEFAGSLKLLLPTLFKRLYVTVKVISQTSDETIRTVLARAYNWSYKCIPELLKAAASDSHPIVRARCTEYLTQILNECPDEQFSSVFVYEKALASLLKKNIKDQDKTVRAATRQLFLAFANVWPQLAHRLYDKFSGTTQRTITAELRKMMD